MISARNVIRLAACSLLVFGVRCEYSGGAGYGGDFGGNSLGGYDSYSHGSDGGYTDGGYSSGGSYGGGYGGGHEDHHHEEHHEAHPYEFGYAVKDPHHGTDFGQEETSDGHNVKGSYRVVLPDGRTQIVTYHADWKNGFHADVKYEGEAHYPEPTHHGGHEEGYHYPSQEISPSYGSGEHFSGYSR